MKKFISIMLVFVLAFAVLIPAGASQSADNKLQFNSDGEFRIMQIADIQDGTVLTPATKKFLKEAVIAAEPDLVVLTGDNISAGSSTVGIKAVDLLLVETAINNFMAVFEEIGVPVAVVFGNHDAEQIVTKEEQAAIYQKYDNCVMVDEGADIYGCGTYNVPIYSSKDASKIAYNLWMFDSNMYDEENGGYDHVHQDQIDWYERRSDELKEANGGEPLPAILFQHIPVQQELNGFKEVSADEEYTFERDGSFYYLANEILEGRVREVPCPPNMERDYTNQLKSWKKQGDIFAAFFGHDHINDFRMSVEGIDLYQTLGAGYFTYGLERGGRLIVLDENEPRKLYTESLQVKRITDTKF